MTEETYKLTLTETEIEHMIWTCEQHILSGEPLVERLRSLEIWGKLSEEQKRTKQNDKNN